MSDAHDVRVVIEGIGKTFSERDVDRWLSYFHPDHTVVYHSTVLVAKSLGDTKSAFAAEIRRLKESGLWHSALDLCNVELIEPQLALASTRWRRWGANNKLLEKLGATYSFITKPSGWNVVTAHDEGVVLSGVAHL